MQASVGGPAARGGPGGTLRSAKFHGTFGIQGIFALILAFLLSLSQAFFGFGLRCLERQACLDGGVAARRHGSVCIRRHGICLPGVLLS